MCLFFLRTTEVSVLIFIYCAFPFHSLCLTCYFCDWEAAELHGQQAGSLLPLHSQLDAQSQHGPCSFSIKMSLPVSTLLNPQDTAVALSQEHSCNSLHHPPSPSGLLLSLNAAQASWAWVYFILCFLLGFFFRDLGQCLRNDQLMNALFAQPLESLNFQSHIFHSPKIY